MKEIGEFLKNARINNGVSIDEASSDLNLTNDEIENIEEANIKAFKDMFTLKELIKSYGKYLGVNTDGLVDEFNDFMFEHTSKISLDDIIEAKKIKEEPVEKKISSPYTNIKVSKYSREDKIKITIIVLSVLFLLGLFGLIIGILTNNDKTVTNELMGKGGIIYEYSN